MRNSKREIARKVDELSSDVNPQGYPVIDSLATMIMYDWDEMERLDEYLYRDPDGQMYHVDPAFADAVIETFTARFEELE